MRSEVVGHMSLITSAFPKANLNNNNNMETNKYMPALYVHSPEVGKPSCRGLHLLLKVRCWLWQSFRFRTYKYVGVGFNTDSQLSYWYCSPFAVFPRRNSTYQLHKFILFQLLVASCPRLLFAMCRMFLYLRLHCTKRFPPESLLCRECWFVSLRIPLI